MLCLASDSISRAVPQGETVSGIRASASPRTLTKRIVPYFDLIDPTKAMTMLTLSPKYRPIISLLLVIHLFCIFVALTSNTAPSKLQQRLRRLLTPYLIPTNFYLDYAPFELTQASEIDGRWTIQFKTDADGAVWIDATEPLNSYLPSNQREPHFARLVGIMVAQQRDEQVAAMLSGLIKRKQAAAANPLSEVRIIRQPVHTLDEIEVANRENAELPPHTPVITYQAGIVFLDDGRVSLVRKDPTGRGARANP